MQSNDSQTVKHSYPPDTSRKLKRAAISVAAVLATGFVVVETFAILHTRALAKDVQEADTAAHPVEVIRAQAIGGARHFSLPGETMAWYTSTIYARVNGYVARWLVDIGDPVMMNFWYR